MSLLDQDLYSKYEGDFVLLWLLKDLGWVLVIPYLCIPAGVIAMVLSIFVTIHCVKDPTKLQHCAIELIWLTGNVLWMVADMLFDDYDYHYNLPYRMVPMFGAQWVSLYHPVSILATACFILGIVVFVAVFAKIISNPDLDKDAWGLMPLPDYKQSFMGFWILKDLLWIQARHAKPFMLGVFVAAIAFAIVADYLRRCLAQGSGNSPDSRIQVVFLLWITGNVIWMSEELPFHEELPWLRFIVATILSVSVAIAVPHATLIKEIAMPEREIQDLGEARSLISGQTKDV